MAKRRWRHYVSFNDALIEIGPDQIKEQSDDVMWLCIKGNVSYKHGILETFFDNKQRIVIHKLGIATDYRSNDTGVTQAQHEAQPEPQQLQEAAGGSGPVPDSDDDVHGDVDSADHRGARQAATLQVEDGRGRVLHRWTEDFAASSNADQVRSYAILNENRMAGSVNLFEEQVGFFNATLGSGVVVQPWFSAEGRLMAFKIFAEDNKGDN